MKRTSSWSAFSFVHIFWLIAQNRKAGLAVSMINVPLCISLAIASGATPVMGLMTGIRSGIIAAIFASNKHNIYGPAGSLAGILLPFSLAFGVQYLPLIAIAWWVVILLIYAFRLTKYITLIPTPALQGFLLGIGLIIWLQQVPAALGLDVSYSLLEVFSHLNEINYFTVSLFVGAMIVLFLFKKFIRMIPGAIPVTVIGVVIWLFVNNESLPETLLLVNQYPDVTFSFWQFGKRETIQWLWTNIPLMRELWVAALWVGIIAILETLISSKIAEKQTKTKSNHQKEVLWLGLANIFSGLIGGLPASALVVRTGLNVRSGATSKLSSALTGIFTGLLSFFLFANSFQFLPFAFIAAILVDVAMGMINISMYHRMRRLEKVSIAIIVVVWVISYVWDPMSWILLGSAIALLVFINRMMKTDLMVTVFRKGHFAEKVTLKNYHATQQQGDIVIVKLDGEINYLTIEKQIQAMQQITTSCTVIIGFGHTAQVDIDALDELDHMIELRHSQNIEVYVTGLQGQCKTMVEQTNFYSELTKNGKVYVSKSALLEKLL